MNRTIKILLVALSIQYLCVIPSRGEASVDLNKVCISHPEPAWWMLARRGMHGKVVCQLIVNKNNGEVTEVKVLKRSRFQQLDAACVMAGFNWKFRPGTVSQVTIPFELELRGYAKEIHR